MKKQVCVFLADGFEEIEGLTVVDLLRRADISVTTVSIQETKLVCGAHQISLYADQQFDEFDVSGCDMVVLPGGMPGTIHLKEHPGVKQVVKRFYDDKKYIAAICAAPTIFGGLGLLEGREATCYPGMEEQLSGAIVVKDSVAVSEHVITSRGLGTAIDFSLTLIEKLVGQEMALQVKESIVYQA